MCGRYTQTFDLEELRRLFGFEAMVDDLPARYNVAPTQLAPVILIEDGQRVLRMMQWGLVPVWAKDPGIGSKMINARAETIAEKPSFRDALRKRRCIIPADGFYEWYQPPGEKRKTPIRFVRKDREPFAFAGLWERWKKPDGEWLLTYTIITTTPNELMKKFHHRMAVVLPMETIGAWLDPSKDDPSALMPLLEPIPASEMEAYAVSTRVNSPLNESPELIEPQGDLFAS